MTTQPLVEFIRHNAVISGLILAAGMFLCYYLLRYMKGSITLQINGRSFQPGSKITGTFDLNTKQEIAGNKLVACLIGTATQTRFSNGRRSTHTDEIFRNEILIEGPRSYPAGFRQQYPFEIPTPQTNGSPGGAQFSNPLLSGAIGFMTNNATQKLHWRLEVRLDAAGVDLATSEKIFLNIL